MIVNIWLCYTVFMVILMAAGGVMGFVKAQSKASLISGVVSAVILGILFAVGMMGHAKEAAAASFITYLLLEVVFFIRMRKTKKLMPGALLLFCSFIGQAISGFTFVGGGMF